MSGLDDLIGNLTKKQGSGGSAGGGGLEDLLNERAGEGWQLKSLTAAQVKGRIGPGGTEGMLAVFERPAVVG